jgi:preprotein translocase subunit SecE
LNSFWKKNIFCKEEARTRKKGKKFLLFFPTSKKEPAKLSYETETIHPR